MSWGEGEKVNIWENKPEDHIMPLYIPAGTEVDGSHHCVFFYCSVRILTMFNRSTLRTRFMCYKFHQKNARTWLKSYQFHQKIVYTSFPAQLGDSYSIHRTLVFFVLSWWVWINDQQYTHTFHWTAEDTNQMFNPVLDLLRGAHFSTGLKNLIHFTLMTNRLLTAVDSLFNI